MSFNQLFRCRSEPSSRSYSQSRAIVPTIGRSSLRDSENARLCDLRCRYPRSQPLSGFHGAGEPALEAAGARYLARGGSHKVYEGDWTPRRIVLLEFPSVEAFEAFYNGSVYQSLKGIRDECSSARLVSVQGIEG
jgi:uncharacterized protein (DUF1330 family)